MLRITGRYLGHSTETKRPGPGQTWQAFDATTVSLMVDGPGGRPKIEELQAGKTLDLAVLDGVEANEDVTFDVTISPYNTRYGGDYRLNAHALVSDEAAGSWPRAVAGD